MKLNFARVCSVWYVPRHTGDITGTRHFGNFGTTSIPVPDTSVTSVRQQYRYRTLRQVWYDSNTVTRPISKFGTTSIPVPDTSVSSVGHQYRTGTGLHVCTGVGTGIDTTWIPVPDTWESSVKHNPVSGTSLRSVRDQPGTTTL